MATDTGFANIVKNGTYNSTVDNDYTVKVIANGLTPATSYFFNFRFNGTIISPTGKFRYVCSCLGQIQQIKELALPCNKQSLFVPGASQHPASKICK